MPAFRIRETQVTTAPSITVETVPPPPAPPDAAAATLRPGVHRFQLVVEDNDGNRSEPVFVDVQVVPRRIIPDLTPGPTRPERIERIDRLDRIDRPGPFRPS